MPRRPLDDNDGLPPGIGMIEVTTSMVRDLRVASEELIDSLLEASRDARRDGMPDEDFMMHVIKESVEGIDDTSMKGIITRAIGEGVVVSALVLRLRDGRQP